MNHDYIMVNDNNWWLRIHDNLDRNNDYPVINHYNPLHGI